MGDRLVKSVAWVLTAAIPAALTACLIIPLLEVREAASIAYDDGLSVVLRDELEIERGSFMLILGLKVHSCNAYNSLR